MSTPRLTVVGAINIDITAHVSRAPHRGETVADGTLTRHPGGKGANQAVAAARLGADVQLIGAVGDDPDGRMLRQGLEKTGVDATGVQTVDQPTGTALIVVDGDGENSIVVCPGANSHIDAARIALADDAAVLAQLEVPLAIIQHVVESTTGFVALNASPITELPAALRERVDLFIVNETEYAAQPWLSDARLVALTLGSRGAILYRDGEEIARASAAATRVVNTVGAGDAFAAALTVGLLREDPPAAALARACAVGAAAVADPASQPSLRSLPTYDGLA
ncbi:ribokinase [Microbacter sp. GSS18]|nr:ribokinase [Microbacter sp. GSS18]